MQDPISDDLLMLERLKKSVKQPEWKVRVEAVRQLPLLGEFVPLSLLVDVMADAHRAVRVAAVEACAELAYRIPMAVVEAALADEHWSVRAAAAWALGHFAERTPKQFLLAIVDDDEESDLVRASALHALGAVKDTAIVQRMIAALRDRSAHLREVAALLLGKWREQTAIPALIHAMDDKDEFVRATVIEALARMEGANFNGRV
jgi:hypothetical protein